MSKRKALTISEIEGREEKKSKSSNSINDHNLTIDPCESPSSASVLANNEQLTGREKFKGKTILFYVPEMEPLAREVVDHSKGKIVLGGLQWKRFADSFPNLRIDIIFEQLAVMYSLPRYLARTMKIIVPYFPTGTMERVDKQGDIATAVTLSRMLSVIPMSARGPSQLCIFDIHTLQNQFYFSDNVLVRLLSCVDLLIRELRKPYMADEDIAIAFPDEGAFKRFSGRFPQYPHIICHKIREGAKRTVKLKEGEVKGKHVVIVDDLIQSGGTMIKCAEMLHENGAMKVSGYVTHAIFPNESYKRICEPWTDEERSMAENALLLAAKQKTQDCKHMLKGQQQSPTASEGKVLEETEKKRVAKRLPMISKVDGKGAGNFTHFWVTNTHPTTQHILNEPPFRVLSAAPVINRFISESD